AASPSAAAPSSPPAAQAAAKRRPVWSISSDSPSSSARAVSTNSAGGFRSESRSSVKNAGSALTRSSAEAATAGSSSGRRSRASVVPDHDVMAEHALVEVHAGELAAAAHQRVGELRVAYHGARLEGDVGPDRRALDRHPVLDEHRVLDRDAGKLPAPGGALAE